MLQLVLGTSGHGKTEYIINKLSEKLKEGRDDVYLIVPDQMTFVMEKTFLNRLGAKLSSRIKIWSFSKLSEEVFRQYGGTPEKPLSETGKFVVLSKAIKNTRDHLKIYHKANDNILKLMLDAIDEFKTNLITPKDLSSILVKGNLKDKLSDIALIYEAYNALIDKTYIDESDILTRAFEIMLNEYFMDEAIVAFDGFESFNKQKLKIISAILKKSEICYVSLSTDTLSINEQSLFEPVARTALDIRRIATEENVKENIPVYFKEAKRYKNPELKFLEKNLLRTVNNEYDTEPENIKIFEAKSVYDEAEYIAATIRNLVIEENYRYGEFSVIAKDPQKYYSVLSPIFEKWQIPFYFQEPVRLDSRPIIRLISAVFRLTSRGFRTEDILILLKTNLTEFNSDDISELENYLYLWKIDGKAWKSEFTKHPKGFGYELTEEDSEKLVRLNYIRKSVTEPIIRFKDKTENKTAREIGAAVYELLTEIKADAVISESFNKYMEMGMPELSKEGAAAWQKLMDILDEFTITFGDEILTIEEYFSVFKDVVSKAETRDIPMRMDTVILSSADIYKPEDEKVSFVMGALQGELPYVPTDSGLFTDNERSLLLSNEINMESRLEDKIKSERFLAYAAAVSSSEKLFVTYHTLNGDEECVPGRIVTDIKKMFPLIKVKRGENLEYYATTYSSAFALFASMYKEETSEKESLKKLLTENESFNNKLISLEHIASRGKKEIEDKSLSEEMFSDTYISASQVESYHRCAFSYFCKYGLNIKEKRTAEIDNLEYGTIMHYLFEAILKSDYNKYVNNREMLKEDVNNLIKAYALEKMGGIENLDGKDKYRFKRLASAAVSMIERFIDELSVSLYRPQYFELYLSDYSAFPPLKIMTDSGKLVSVGGIADRIDVYENHKGKFVRVIDYKTGTKEFKYSDVLFGLNLQMLIYLAAMAEKGTVIPSGILYLPSSVPEISGSKNISEEAAQKEADKKLASSGIVLDDIEIINAMEKGGAGRFLPTGIKDNGNFTKPQSVINDKGFKLLFSHVKNLIKTMAQNLIDGEIAADPLMVNNNSCTWCPYGSICGNIKDDRAITKLKLNKEDVLKEIERREGEENAKMD